MLCQLGESERLYSARGLRLSVLRNGADRVVAQSPYVEMSRHQVWKWRMHDQRLLLLWVTGSDKHLCTHLPLDPIGRSSMLFPFLLFPYPMMSHELVSHGVSLRTHLASEDYCLLQNLERLYQISSST